MPRATLNNADIYYEEHGSGSETIIFSHGLIWSGEMFANQVEHLSNRYRCITFDFRGQGKSAVTADGYDMDTLTDDALALIEHLNCAPCHFAGLSMGGFIGLRLAIRHPEVLKSLILMETTADPEDKVKRYKRLNMIARWFGLGVVANKVMPIMFGQKYLTDPARAEERERWRHVMIANDKKGITRAVDGVIYREGIADEIHKIAVPTLIIVGDQDMATEQEKSEKMHAAIPNSQLVMINGAGHSSTIEEPVQVNQALDAFLSHL